MGNNQNINLLQILILVMPMIGVIIGATLQHIFSRKSSSEKYLKGFGLTPRERATAIPIGVNRTAVALLLNTQVPMLVRNMYAPRTRVGLLPWEKPKKLYA